MSEIIPKSSLKVWADRKFREHRTTMDLMACAKNNHDKTAIAIVALLEVEPASRYRGMCEEESQYLKSCHAYLRTLFSDPGEARELGAQ